MKLQIPKFRYLAQDIGGAVTAYTHKPSLLGNYWACYEGQTIGVIFSGNINDNWQDTLIDLEVDDYDYCDGILRRI